MVLTKEARSAGRCTGAQAAIPPLLVLEELVSRQLHICFPVSYKYFSFLDVSQNLTDFSQMDMI